MEHRGWTWGWRGAVVGGGALVGLATATPAGAQPECRVLNVPRLAAKPEAERSWIGDRHEQHRKRAGVAWFGRFDRNANYTELRAIYDPEGLDLSLHVSDLFVWWILTDGVQWGGELVSDPEQWDAVEIAIDPEGGSAPSVHALRMLVAAYPFSDPATAPETGEPHRATRTWRGTGTGWAEVADARAEGARWYHTMSSAWLADPGPNDNTADFDVGHSYQLFVPWAALGEDAEPASGRTLRMMVRTHDIDDPRDADVTLADAPSTRGSSEVGPLPPTAWPESASVDDPSTWATVVLNQAPYAPPAVASEQTVVLAPGDVDVMRDVTVGGHSFLEERWLDGGGAADDYAWETCMDTRFGTSGDLYTHAEGQPTHLCFFSRSLFYYDLGTLIPEGSVVTSAELSLVQFGPPVDPSDPTFEEVGSPLQVHRLEGDWLDLPLDQGVTWNTAPLAAENAGYGYVASLPQGEASRRVTFDVSPIVARAVLRAEPVNLALYGADTTANTDKHFRSSEGGGVDDVPLLTITYGTPVDPATVPDAESCTLGVAAALFPEPGTGTPEAPVPPNTEPIDPTPPGGDGTGGSGASGSAEPSGGSDDGGCGCRTAAPGPGPAASALAVVLLAGVIRRRRGPGRRRAPGRRHGLGGLVALALGAALGTLTPRAHATDWLQHQGGPAHTGYTSDAVPRQVRLAWRVSPGPIAPNVQPIVVGGRVIVGLSSGEVIAYDASSGVELWTYACGGAIRGSAASDGELVFVGSADRKLTALSVTDGTLVWDRRFFGPLKAAPVVADEHVYVAANRGGLTKLAAATGDVVWTVPYDVPVFTTPAVADGVVYTLPADASLRALDAATGNQLWATQLVGQPPGQGWVVAGGGAVYGAVRAWSGFWTPIEEGTRLIEEHASESLGAQRDAVLEHRAAFPYHHELYALDVSTGSPLPLPVMTAWRGIGDLMRPPVVAPDGANLFFRWSAGEPNTTGGGATVIGWSQHLGRYDAATAEVVPLDNDGSVAGLSGDQAFLISDEGWSAARGGDAVIVQSWHGLYGLDVTTHTKFPLLLHSRAQASDVMDTADVVLFEGLAAESREGGGGVPPAIADGSLYYQLDNQLVALAGVAP